MEEPQNNGGKEASTWLKENIQFLSDPQRCPPDLRGGFCGVGSTLEGGRWASLGAQDILSTYPFSALTHPKKQECVFGSLHA